jgi:hypothetical protein
MLEEQLRCDGISTSRGYPGTVVTLARHPWHQAEQFRSGVWPTGPLKGIFTSIHATHYAVNKMVRGRHLVNRWLYRQALNHTEDSLLT